MPVPAQPRVVAGTEIPLWSMARVSPEPMKLYAALAQDPTPIHWDHRAVKEKGLGDRVINQGPINLGYVINMLMAWTGPASIRDVAARFTDNVFEGDAVVAGGVVTAVREHQGEWLADCDVWLERGDGVRAVVATATVALTG
jgi:acyl dehydratase